MRSLSFKPGGMEELAVVKRAEQGETILQYGIRRHGFTSWLGWTWERSQASRFIAVNGGGWIVISMSPSVSNLAALE